MFCVYQIVMSVFIFVFFQINVIAKVIQVKHAGEQDTRDGKILPFKTYIISDSSGSDTLTVWGEHHLAISYWYNFEKVTVKTFNNCKVLSTTPQTKITTSPPGQRNIITPTNEEKVTGQIARVNVKRNFICKGCRRPFPDFNPDSFSIKCMQCGDRVKIYSLQPKVKVILTIQIGQMEKRFNLPSYVLKDIVKDVSTQTTEELEVQLLKLDQVTITTEKGQVTKVVPAVSASTLDTLPDFDDHLCLSPPKMSKM